MKRVGLHNIVAMVLSGLDRYNMLIPDSPAVADMAESAATIPEATYNLRVYKAEYVSTPKTAGAKGPYIKAQFVVTGPDDDVSKKSIGRMVFQNLSLTGDGSFRLRELLKVTGHPDDFRLEDSDQLLGLEVKAAVVVQKGTGGYADKNEIRRFMPIV